ncbi:polysaccharide biosynthesis C-terminal domain-containing protein [Candidatus Gottesmanbacteria bacterium]|nr:polysaccharide biosynthesis C-terminal domain-containing protein [Candidatus Gottesmanbacteria bacterium]
MKASPKKLVLTNTIHQIIGKIVGSLTVGLVSFIIGHLFGPSGYGDFTKIATYVSFYFLFADFGLNAVYLQKRSAKITWQVLLATRILLISLCIAIALLFLTLLPSSETNGYTLFVKLGIILFLPSIISQSLITTANAVFQETLSYIYATAANIVGSLATLAVLVLLYIQVFPTSVYTGIIAVLIGSVVTALVSLLFIFRRRYSLIPTFHWNAIALLTRGSVPLALTLLVNLVYFRIDSIILTLTRTTEEVGLYGLAYKIFELPLVFPTFFMNAVYPFLLTSVKEERTEQKYFLRLIFRASMVLLLIAIPSGIALWVLAPFVVYVRSDFSGSIAALRILSLSLPFFFLSSSTMWGLISLRLNRELLTTYTCGLLLNLTLNLAFIPRYGIIAAAISTGVTEGVVLALSVYFLWKNFQNK